MEPRCAVCQKEGTFACPACRMVVFCTKGCEQAHWSRHRTVCDTLFTKLLSRIGDTAQQAFQIFSEQVYDRDIVQVTCHQNKIIAHKSQEVGDNSGRPLAKFPSSLVPDLQERCAILCHGRSDVAIAILHKLIADMLKGIRNLKIQEVTVQMRRPACVKVVSEGDPVDATSLPRSKIVLQIHCPIRAQDWIIDPTCATEGTNYGAILAIEFFNNQVEGDPARDSFGTQQQCMQGFAQLDGFAGLKFKGQWIGQQYLQDGAMNELANMGVTMDSLLRLPDEPFYANQQRLLRSVRDSLEGVLTSNQYIKQIRSAYRMEQGPILTRRN